MNTNALIKKQIFSKDNIQEFLKEDYCRIKNICYSRLVYDGFVDESQFSGIVFLLKESVENGIVKDYIKSKKYSEDFDADGNWSFTETTYKESTYQKEKQLQGKDLKHWPNICYWVEAIHSPQKAYLEVHNTSTAAGNLSKVAIVNIKKVAGESSSDEKIFNKISKSKLYSDAIKKQLKLIDGDTHRIKIVVCGGSLPYNFAKERKRIRQIFR